MRHCAIVLVFMLSVVVAAAVRAADGSRFTIAEHVGATDPATEGWTAQQRAGVASLPVTALAPDGETGYDAWRVSDSSRLQELLYVKKLSNADLDRLADGFVFSARLRVFDRGRKPDSAVNIRHIANGRRWQVRFGSTDAGDPVVQLYGTADLVLTGLGPGYHLYEVRDLDGDGSADLYVDGVETYTAWRGLADRRPAQVEWGSGATSGQGSAAYNLVRLASVTASLDQGDVMVSQTQTPKLVTHMAPRSDGCILHVDFENYVDRTYPLLNAGIRWLGFPGQEQDRDQHRVDVLRGKRTAFAGMRCGHVSVRRVSQTGRILLQARHDAPVAGDVEVSEFVFRPALSRAADLEEFPVWRPVESGGVCLLAHGTAESGVYTLDVHDRTGRISGVATGLKQHEWARFILVRDRPQASVQLWLVSAEGEKRVGTYGDVDPGAPTRQVEIGESSQNKGRGAGYWDDVRVGRVRTADTQLAQPETMRDVGKERAEIAYPIAVGTAKQLFVDDVLIHSLAGLTRTLHPVEKHPANPLIVADKPWEKCVLLYGGVCRDPAMGNRFRMWYLIWGKHYGLPTFIGYAESEDGFNWAKPNLGLHDFEGSKANNIVMPGHSNCTFLFDPAHPAPSMRHQALLRYRGLRGFTSPDGFLWKDWGNVISQGFDSSSLAWDPVHEKWLASIKISRDGKRSRGYAESSDFQHWTDTYLMLHSDAEDESAEQLYAQNIFCYETLYLSFLRVFDTRTDKVDVQLASSRNARCWDRQFRRPLIPTANRKGAWDWGNNAPAGNPPIRVGDELWIYYSGRSTGHNEKPNTGAIGLGILRLDGFVSVDAGSETGVLTTVPLVLKGTSLYVNAAAAGGQLEVEIVHDRQDGASAGTDALFEPVEGYGRRNCLPIRSDSVRHRVAWEGADDLEPLRGRPVRLRFYLRDAELYSFWTE